MQELLTLLTAVLRYAFPAAALFVLASSVISLFRNRPRVHKMAQLVNTQTGEAVEIKHWETSIGKSKSNDIVLAEPGVSRFHAVIAKKRRDWTVTDTFSKNGVKINGEKIDSRGTLEDGDVIEIGSSAFEFQCADAISSATKQQIKNEAGGEMQQSVAFAVLVDVKSRKPVYLKKHDVLIGRGNDCDIQILSDTVSSQHARIHRTSRGWALSDLDSLNGTKLNGRFINQPQLIFDEDMLSFGDRVMIFYEK